MNKIFGLVGTYEQDFLTRTAKIVDGYEFNQLDTIKRIHLYYASRFESGNSDDQGHKYFYNISKPRVKNAVKNLDIDTKDIQIRSINGKHYAEALIMRRDVQNWMTERKMGQLLNRMVESFPVFGHVVLKKTGGDGIFDLVDLRNLKCDKTADKLEESWVIEDHYYTPTELRAKKDVWNADEIEEAIRSFTDSGKENYVDNSNDEDRGEAQYIHVREFYGHVNEELLMDEGDEFPEEESHILAQFILVLAEGTDKAGLILHKSKIKEIPYKDLAYDKVDGRWMGRGVVEDLFEMQMMKNEEINQMMLAERLANMIFLQTRDETMARNVLTDLVNGDILNVKSELTRISTEVRNNGGNQIISNEINDLANQLTNSFEVMTGDGLPSGTPFRLGALMNQNANKLFDFIRENLGLLLQDVFEEWVLPELEKDLNKEHVLQLLDQEEIEWFNEKLKKNKVWDATKKYIMDEGRLPSQEEVTVATTLLEEQIDSKDATFLEIPKDFYDFEKKVEVIITGERQDDGVDMATLGTILQLAGQNPEALENPIVKRILDKKGYSPSEFAQKKTQPQQGAEALMQSLTPQQ